MQVPNPQSQLQKPSLSIFTPKTSKPRNQNAFEMPRAIAGRRSRDRIEFALSPKHRGPLSLVWFKSQMRAHTAQVRATIPKTMALSFYYDLIKRASSFWVRIRGSETVIITVAIKLQIHQMRLFRVCSCWPGIVDLLDLRTNVTNSLRERTVCPWMFSLSKTRWAWCRGGPDPEEEEGEEEREAKRRVSLPER